MEAPHSLRIQEPTFIQNSVAHGQSVIWISGKTCRVIGFHLSRLRASWGLAGNLSGIGSYDRFSTYLAGSINGIATYNVNTALGNQFVEPERSSEFEIGTDLSFFKNKLGIVFTVYNKKIVDNTLLVDRVLAPSSGGSTRVENVGNLTNEGWELGIKANPVSGNDFNWNICCVCKSEIKI